MTRLLVSYVSISRPIPVFLSTSVDQWPARRRTNQTYKKVCLSCPRIEERIVSRELGGEIA